MACALLSSQVEASKTQLMQLQGLVEAASAAQMGFEASMQKVRDSGICIGCVWHTMIGMMCSTLPQLRLLAHAQLNMCRRP